MKKTKLENTSITHSLAAKRASLNHDKLHLSYKADWDTSMLQNVDNKSNSNKAFFQNMKQELSTIKNDFEKLLKKESSFNSTNKPSREENNAIPYQTIGGIVKGKSMSSYKKDDKKVFFQNFDDPKKYEMTAHKESVNELISNKLLSAQKNAAFSQKKPLFSQTMHLKQKDYLSNNLSAKTSANKYSEQSEPLTQQSYKLALASNRESKTPIQKEFIDKTQKNSVEREKQNLRLKQLVAKLNEEISIYKKDRQALRTEFEKASTQKQLYISKLTEMSKELSLKMNYATQQELKIKELSQELKKKEKQLGESSGKTEDIDKERAFYTDTINELRFHNENFHNINCQLGQQNERLKQNLHHMQHFIQHTKQLAENAENDLKRKLEFAKKEVQQYQKREVMFTKQIERLSQMVSQSQSVQHHNKDKELLYVNHSDAQVLYQKVEDLTKQLELQKQINVALSQKYEENLKKMNIYELKANFEQKINLYIDQNTKLKTLINSLQAENQSLTEQNHSYQRQIELYEQRERNLKQTKKLTSTEWEEMTQEIQKLKQENKILVQKLQTKEMKQQVIKMQNCLQIQPQYQQNILKLAHSQLQEIQELKVTINELQIKNESLNRQNLIFLQKNPHNTQSQIIAALKELIFKILVQKIGKEEQEDDAQFFLRRVQQMKPWLVKNCIN